MSLLVGRPSSTGEALRRPGQVERLATMATLFILAYAVPTTWFRVYSGDFIAVRASDPVTQLVFLGLYGFLLSRLLGNETQLVRTVRLEPLLFAWVGFALLSVVWSGEPGRTINVGTIFLFTTLIAYYLFIRYELIEVLWMMMWVALLGVAINLVFAIGLPTYGQTPVGWSGVQTDKNSLGRSSVFDMITLLMAGRLFRRFRMIAYTGAAGAVALIVGSTSKTSLGAMAGIIVFLIVFQAFRGRKTLYGAVAMLYVTATVIGIWVGLRSLEVITDILDKDVSLTGRTVLWELVLREVPERLWFGSGFGAFWTDWFGPSHEIWIDFGSRLPHAHNALLEYLLELGVIGAGLFMFVYLRGVVRATRFVRARAGVTGLWPLTILSYTLLFSLTEVGIQGRNIFWVAFILALLTVARQQKVSAEEGRVLRRMRSFGLRPDRIDLDERIIVPETAAGIDQPRKQRV